MYPVGRNPALNPNFISSCTSSFILSPGTSQSIHQGNEFQEQISVSSPQYSIDTAPLNDSNDGIHQNVSLVVR